MTIPDYLASHIDSWETAIRSANLINLDLTLKNVEAFAHNLLYNVKPTETLRAEVSKAVMLSRGYINEIRSNPLATPAPADALRSVNDLRVAFSKAEPSEVAAILFRP